MQSKKLPQPEEYFSYDRLEEASKETASESNGTRK